MGYPNVMLTKMIVDVIKPIIWANRLGGPGTNFSLNGVLGTMTVSYTHLTLPTNREV